MLILVFLSQKLYKGYKTIFCYQTFDCFVLFCFVFLFVCLIDCLDRLNAVALTIGPGLPFSLAVGLQKAKELTVKYKKPLITVNHMEGHALVVRLIDRKYNIKNISFSSSLSCFLIFTFLYFVCVLVSDVLFLFRRC